MTNEELVQYYQDLLIIQYSNKEKAGELVSLVVSEAMIYELIAKVRDGFDIETATGKQLDVLAKYVGANRVVSGSDFTRAYFGFIPYEDTEPYLWHGFIKYTVYLTEDTRVTESGDTRVTENGDTRIVVVPIV